MKDLVVIMIGLQLFIQGMIYLAAHCWFNERFLTLLSKWHCNKYFAATLLNILVQIENVVITAGVVWVLSTGNVVGTANLVASGILSIFMILHCKVMMMNYYRLPEIAEKRKRSREEKEERERPASWNTKSNRDPLIEYALQHCKQ